MSKPKFSVIYADPPWSYKDAGCNGAAAGQYSLLSNAEIAALPVHLMAEKDCVLFMWATYPLMREALATIAGWGFEYKSIGFQWVKLNPKAHTPFYGLGRWTRGNTEPCLIGVRGKPKPVSKGVHQLIDEAVLEDAIQRHSAKPAAAREKIVQLMGEVPRLELFARERAPGWVATGAELDGLDIRTVLQHYSEG
jgi:N6-adenosine-specific RNA methylase IME4